jgi:hypothetical protein
MLEIRAYLIEESKSVEVAERFLSRLIIASRTLDTLPSGFLATLTLATGE